MKLEPFALERIQSIWENQVAWNLVGERRPSAARLRAGRHASALHDALLEQELGYTQTNGTIALREAIAAMYPGADAAITSQVTNGGSEANCILLMRLVEPGDEVVFMMPNYMQAAGLARALGATVQAVAAAARPGHGATQAPLDSRSRRARARWSRRRTRAIVICNPNNPTGARLDAPTLDADLPRSPRRVGAWVIDDEIYRGAEREADDTPTMWGATNARSSRAACRRPTDCPGCASAGSSRRRRSSPSSGAIHDYTTIAPGAHQRSARAHRARAGAARDGCSRARATIIRTQLSARAALDRAGRTASTPHRARSRRDRLRAPHAPDPIVGARRRGCATSGACSSCPGDHFDMDGYLRHRLRLRSGDYLRRSALTHRRRVPEPRIGACMRADLVLVGFGNVGRRFARLLEERRDWLSLDYDLDCRVVGIATRRHGSVFRSRRHRRASAAAVAVEGGHPIDRGGPAPPATAST